MAPKSSRNLGILALENQLAVRNDNEAATGGGGNNKSVGLKSFLNDLGAVVSRLPAAWVRCELHTLEVRDRYVRMEFIELDAFGKQVARAQGGCWPQVWQHIVTSFDAAGLRLEAGSQVMVKLKAQVNVAFGMQVDVLEFDLTFALGDLNARILAIRGDLQKAGIWGRNRSLVRPADFLRVAVISPAGAAGLGDFRSTVDQLANEGLVEFVYYEAPFQTPEAPARITEILRGIYKDCKVADTRYCAVAIIRGGGASADLAWLVDHKLAEAVCLMNVPILTGIGHERNLNLLDEIACISCDTPSKAAEHIRTTITRAALAGDDAYKLIQAQVTQTLDKTTSKLTNINHSLERDSKESVRMAEIMIRTAAIELEPNARNLLSDTFMAVTTSQADAHYLALQMREAAVAAIQRLYREAVNNVEAALRPVELGKERAISEIAIRVEAVPQSVVDDLKRLRSDIAGDIVVLTQSSSNQLNSTRNQILVNANRTVDECAAAIALVLERAAALHPRTVLAAGYAILRNSEGSPLTTVAALHRAVHIVAELRDGSAELALAKQAINGGENNI